MRQNALLYLNAELDPSEQRAVQRQVAAGKLYRVRPGIATPMPEAQWPTLFRREKFRILSALFPGSVVAYRSAFDALLGSTVYLMGSYARVVDLPGMKVSISSGSGPIDGDTRIQGRELYFPSRERILIDAMAPAPRGDDPQYSRKITAEELEERLISICDSRGESSFLELRDRVKLVGVQLKTPKSHLNELDQLIGAILGTRPDRKMSTSKGVGLSRGYDAQRMDLFHKLVQSLKTTELAKIEDVVDSSTERINFAFLESYFSNFIEGTEFDIAEARSIALDGKLNELRPKDSHDIRGVFSQAHNPEWRARAVSDIKSFDEALRERHALMMAERPEVLPGEFKVTKNVAGNTAFVDPRLVVGTLREAGLLLHDVEAGLPRALLMKFIVSEVHPFNDGNGRLARLMMNSELSAAGQARIIIPTLYREQYLDCLRELTRAGRTQPYLDAMMRAQQWTAAFNYESLDATIDQMQRCNAFERSLVQFKMLWPENLDESANESASFKHDRYR